jgi:hypothetical protein
MARARVPARVVPTCVTPMKIGVHRERLNLDSSQLAPSAMDALSFAGMTEI